jgi:hypothetical protein
MTKTRFILPAGILVLSLACTPGFAATVTFFDDLAAPSNGVQGNDSGNIGLAQRFTATANAPIDPLWSFNAYGFGWYSSTATGPFQIRVVGDSNDNITSVTAMMSTDSGLGLSFLSLAIYTDLLANDPIFDLPQFQPGVELGTLSANANLLTTSLTGVLFTGSEIDVTPGDHYWVVLTASPDPHAPDGQVYWSSTDVPEPGTFALMTGMIGVLGIAWRFWR